MQDLPGSVLAPEAILTHVCCSLQVPVRVLRTVFCLCLTADVAVVGYPAPPKKSKVQDMESVAVASAGVVCIAISAQRAHPHKSIR
jgi:hypothetical protein